MVIPSDYNIQKKTTEKMSKYTDLQIECQRMWNKKVEVIPVIIGATGIVDRTEKSQDPTTPTTSKDQQSWVLHISSERYCL